MMKKSFLILFFWLIGVASAWAEPVTARLVSDRTTIAPGSSFTVALALTHAEGWHTYWKNPGDTGLPTTLRLTLPDGISAGPLQFQAPEAQVFGAYMNYGYSGAVLLPMTLKVASDARLSSPLTLKARADWLMCAEQCIPGGADLVLTLKVGTKPETDPAWATQLDKLSSPPPLTGWQMSAKAAPNGTIALTLTPEQPTTLPDELYFFADQAQLIEPSLAQPLTRDGAALRLTLPVSYRYTTQVSPRLTGILRMALDGKVVDAALDVPIAGHLHPGTTPRFDAPPTARVPGLARALPAAPPLSLPLLLITLASALLGGMLLNLMPCVFPVISLKALGLVQHHDNRAALRGEAVLFAAGVIVSFLALGGLLTALRALGAELGWGFQLQSPPVVLGLALLFFAMALNLSGVYEFGLFVPQKLMQGAPHAVSAFASGVLAVIVASPCTAPFMGTALGAALTQPLTVVLLIFAALGVGMALPYVLLALFPTWQRFLPRPGAWMERLRQWLAFPLYATVVWLVWVLGAQLGNDAVARLLFALTLVALLLWAYQRYRLAANLEHKSARGWLGVSLVVLVGTVWMLVPLFATPQATISQESDAVWQPYDETNIAKANAEGKTVFVDFTAAWCVTCQINKKAVLETATVQKAFAQHGIVLMRADWTRRDSLIADALARLGRNGVPVYALYRPGHVPQLLPELLRQETVLEALQQR